MPSGLLQQPGIHGMLHIIVRIHKADVLAGSQFHAGIARRGQSAVFPVHHPDAAIPFSPRAENGGRAVHRAVIHADDFNVLQRLAGQAFHAGIQVGSHIITGKNDGNSRAHARKFLCNRISNPEGVVLRSERVKSKEIKGAGKIQGHWPVKPRCAMGHTRLCLDTFKCGCLN